MNINEIDWVIDFKKFSEIKSKYKLNNIDLVMLMLLNAKDSEPVNGTKRMCIMVNLVLKCIYPKMDRFVTEDKIKRRLWRLSG